MSAQVKSGYKLTEAGVIPDDWSCTSLATLATSVASGRSKPDAIYGEYPVYGSTGIIGNTNNASHAGEVILVARVGANAGKLNLVAGKFGVTDNTIIIRLKDNLCLPFFYLQLKRKNLNSLVFGSGQPLITGTQLKALVIPIPELLEQRSIAAALSDMDALISGLDQLIAKKRDIKQAAMQQLLTGQQRLPGFSGEWEVKPLRNLASIQRGASPRPIDSPIWFDDRSLVGWVRISDVTRSNIFLRETTQRLSTLGVKHSRPVSRGSLIMSICATVGRPVITEIDTCIHDGFVVFDDLKINKHFMYYVLKFIEGDWSRHGQTGSQMNLNTGLIKSTEIPVPPDEEQTAIVSILSDMDSELSILDTRRDKAHQLKQAMMQELLTGRIRLA